MKAALLVLSFGMLAACTESFDLTRQFSAKDLPSDALVIDNVAGNVRLRKGSAGAISGTVRIHAAGFDKSSQARAAAEQVAFVERIEGGELVVSVVLPEAHRNKVFAVNIDLEVPEGLVVSAFTDAGRVNIEGLLVHEIDTARGDVDLAFTGSLIDEEASIRTSDGRVTIDSHDGDLDILTTNAPLDLFSVAGNVRATTTQGPITARVLPPNRGEVILATTNAPIDLSVPRDFGAELIAVTSAPGAVFISGDLIFTPRRSFPDQAEGTLGNGAGRVDLRTIGADIAVHR